MPKLTEAKFSIIGKSGKKYLFNIYSTDTSFQATGAIYLFTKRKLATDKKHYHTLIYCGITGDLSERFNNHHKDHCIEKNGANCICTMSIEKEEMRKQIEADILKAKNCACNEVLN